MRLGVNDSRNFSRLHVSASHSKRMRQDYSAALSQKRHKLIQWPVKITARILSSYFGRLIGLSFHFLLYPQNIFLACRSQVLFYTCSIFSTKLFPDGPYVYAFVARNPKEEDPVDCCYGAYSLDAFENHCWLVFIENKRPEYGLTVA